MSLGYYVVSVTAVSEPDNAISITFKKLDFLKLAQSASLLHRRKLNSHVSISFVDLEVHDGATIHTIFEIILSHKTCDEISKIFFSNSDLEGDACDHKSSHFLGIS